MTLHTCFQTVKCCELIADPVTNDWLQAYRNEACQAIACLTLLYFDSKVPMLEVVIKHFTIDANAVNMPVWLWSLEHDFLVHILGNCLPAEFWRWRELLKGSFGVNTRLRWQNMTAFFFFFISWLTNAIDLILNGCCVLYYQFNDGWKIQQWHKGGTFVKMDVKMFRVTVTVTLNIVGSNPLWAMYYHHKVIIF